jgi:hypothetical protein
MMIRVLDLNLLLASILSQTLTRTRMLSLIPILILTLIQTPKHPLYQQV